MSRYKAYPSYKETRHSWLDSVPAHWEMLPLKFLTEQHVTDGPHETPEFIDEGVPFLSVDGIQNNQLVFEGCRYISREDHARYSIKCKPNQGDVLLGKAASVGKVAHVNTDIEFNVWSPLAVIRPRSKKTGRFIYYSLQSALLQMQCDMYSNANTQKNLGMSTIDNLAFASPTDDEAEQVANFLDHETAKIDALIEKQQRLIELLREKRQAVISHAVTKGLNPNAPMKDSGVVWLGAVPAHWKICALKYPLKSLDSRRIPLSGEERSARQGEYRYYGASGVIDYIDDYIFDEPTVLVGEDGANLVNRSTPLAFSATGKYWVNNHAHILKAEDDLVDFWAEAIEHIDINSLVSGSAQPKLTAENLNNLKITFPLSASERKEISDFIEGEKIKFKSLIKRAELQITLLQERRTALISAAVTGKIDVRDWQAAA